ncbi:uncharacterized protein LOC143668273 [Tamandua tetradactyla]|uniref:uncharacterized protein LOC143668273 n=1 Tax=Tamandua tetradactyla TaxID=48850 RepID=UPI00405446C8
MLYIEEKRGVARGVLTQALGPWRRPVAYLSKRLDSVASGWPRCLKAIAAAALLAKDTDKLTVGQKLTIIAPHAWESIIRQPPDRWMSNARITHYQSILLDKDRVTFGAPSALNPATLLPDETAGPVLHTCQEILAEETGIRRDLKDQPLPNSEVTWFSDGSSFLQHGCEPWKKPSGSCGSSSPPPTSQETTELHINIRWETCLHPLSPGTDS